MSGATRMVVGENCYEQHKLIHSLGYAMGLNCMLYVRSELNTSSVAGSDERSRYAMGLVRKHWIFSSRTGRSLGLLSRWGGCSPTCYFPTHPLPNTQFRRVTRRRQTSQRTSFSGCNKDSLVSRLSFHLSRTSRHVRVRVSGEVEVGGGERTVGVMESTVNVRRSGRDIFFTFSLCTSVDR